MNVQHIIAGLEALGWTVVYTVEDDWFASHYYRRLSLPMTCDEQADLGLLTERDADVIVLHELGHCLDAALAFDVAEGIGTTNPGRKLRDECVAWSWALRHAEWPYCREVFLKSIGSYLDHAAEALGGEVGEDPRLRLRVEAESADW